jgi:hypothetical protein
MARKSDKVTIPLVPGDLERVDGMCPNCWLPSLVKFHVYGLFLNSVEDMGTMVLCTDCKTIVYREQHRG